MRRRLDESGVSLVEVIVYVIVSGLILAGVALMFTHGLSEQTKATKRDFVTGPANTISTSLAELRNATLVEQVATESGDGIVATLVNEEGSLYCRAWIVGDSGTVSGDLLYTAPASIGHGTDLSEEAKIAISDAAVLTWGALARHNDKEGRVDEITGSITYSSDTDAVAVDLKIIAGPDNATESVEIKNIIIAQALVPGAEGMSCVQD